MEKTSIVALVISVAICLISSLLSLSHAKHSLLDVIGKVYCDTCRVEFETKLSQPINGNMQTTSTRLELLYSDINTYIYFFICRSESAFGM